MTRAPVDQQRVRAAIEAAEARTDGELLAILSPQSDTYHDVALQWAVLLMVTALGVVTAFPDAFIGLAEWIAGDWSGGITRRSLLLMLFALLVAIYLAARIALRWPALRLALVPGLIKSRRVRRRAIALFKVGAEQHTISRTGVLLYVSLAEQRAEIVADEAVHNRVPAEMWGDAMVLLIDAIRDGRPTDGMVAAIEAIGDILAREFPYTGTDPAELPNHLIVI
ncbi:putative membrane protein [Sphingomonas laterariae]|uniref:Putative membrane protein n=1 Tax=Edaphosphingomonas laterariae TaxID=861865 RepID=A0A239J6F6_9SPHN|nr:hypothetical protein [Sphingomonas laterariae]SNT01410.1 putative membrane protein [Sphingomonas laterariae]